MYKYEYGEIFRTNNQLIIFYFKKNFSRSISGINKFSCVCPGIGINILDFKYTKDNKFYKNYHIREDKTNEIFTDILEWHIIELPKLPKENNGSSIYNWAKFIKTEKKDDLKMISKTDSYLDEAYKQLEIISQDKEKQIAYTSRLKSIMDYNTIMEERYEKGRQEGRQELLNQLIESGIKIPEELLKNIK